MNSFDVAMDRLRLRFVARAAEDLLKLRGHQDGAALPRKDLHALVHRLAGSAGIFGFAEISKVAGELDDRLLDGGDAETLPKLVAALAAVVLESGANG